MVSKEVLICGGTGCLSAGAEDVENEFLRLFEDRGISSEFPLERAVKKTGCIGPCSMGPTVLIMPDEVLYVGVGVDDVKRIVEEHLLEGEPVRDLMISDDRTPVEKFSDQSFFRRQTRIALRNNGLIDPLNLDDYLAREGYESLKKALREMTPEAVIEEVKTAGLRGRGGAGFPTGLKWHLTREAEGERKFVVCNADEGDPGAFMDRSILEGDPHSIIEAMTIAGYAIGADTGYVYVRAEYPLAIANLKHALADARERGFLGENILDSEFDFEVSIRVGAGAFVCGEETALIASIEGKRGYPRSKPPFPATHGLWGYPTVINNVETLANIAPIISRGGEWFSGIGTESSPGTKVFAVAGDVKHTGLVEVPMGTTLREIIFDIAGGIPGGKELKAVQIGGPSGGTLPAEHLDMEVDFESLKSVGAIVGSGGLVVMDEDNCMVDVARFFLDFTQDESCGKCTPCRIGTKRMLDILLRITAGGGEPGDIAKLESLAELIKSTSLCGLGQTAPNPVLSTLRFFRSEYEAHIHDKVCPTGRCKALVNGYLIDPQTCIGCAQCVEVCPVDAITGEFREPHEIDLALCTACGACAEVCPVDAISPIGVRERT